MKFDVSSYQDEDGMYVAEYPSIQRTTRTTPSIRSKLLVEIMDEILVG